MLTLDFLMKKSERRLNGLHPVVREATVKLIELSHAEGIPILIAQGLRTIEEQNALYEQGRTKPGNIVTQVRGGYSYHNFGVAIDFCIYTDDGKDVVWTVDSRWMKVVSIAKQLGFEWGGDWTGFKDYPHFEMTFGLSCAQYRNGAKPSQSRLDSALKQIRSIGGSGEMSAEDKALLESLKKRVETLETRNKMKEIPAWALEACVNAKRAGVIDTTADGSYDFYRFVTMLDRMGSFAKEGIENER